MNGEEEQCASHIDGHPNVRRWIRNTEHATQGGFWLPKSPGRFFPDFIVELTDGRIVLVEYKGKDRAHNPEELHKKAVGELWASRSAGRCRFAWVVDKDWHTLTSCLDG
jgi:type III restriction enzyme